MENVLFSTIKGLDKRAVECREKFASFDDRNRQTAILRGMTEDRIKEGELVMAGK